MKALDLCCRAGGASVGLHRAGLEVTGCDQHFFADYPFPMVVGDAMTLLRCPDILDAFDLVAISPPCQRWSYITPPSTRHRHPDLLTPARELLQKWGGYYVIENVEGAPLQDPVMLCGSMFGLGVRRHRLFEANFPIPQPDCRHDEQGEAWGVYGERGQNVNPPRAGTTASRGKKARDPVHAREVMGIDWMSDWRDMAEAIPPAYTEHIGKAFLSLGGSS